ncbi:MAG: hypothetical protein OM95_02855 [Bdellovibrio sp. ArHS]|uniref:hypothetical protein n=1 Tax=Bdellovibrio sp. ArHS TaxID=1569284 RepID=UPI000583320E|nr:hypothetical protein [Bdellovibrio sp. ArHS]KHD89537.1 MAG: hypothetical protein OM95_02855 [Bdellovibrio sp. ArHS]
MKFKHTLLISLAIALCGSLGFAATSGRARACLTEHIDEAIDLNSKRAPFYEKLSSGKSKIVTKKLIAMERRLRLVAPVADFMVAKFQRAGIPMTCDYFISMNHTPKFRAVNPAGPDSLKNFRAANVDVIKKYLLKLYKQRAYGDLAQYADDLVIELEREPRYNCMVRHILESIRRIALVIPHHERLAQERLGDSSLFMANLILRSHITLLNESGEIDNLAAPLQAEALPIVCQDVPYIPVLGI